MQKLALAYLTTAVLLGGVNTSARAWGHDFHGHGGFHGHHEFHRHDGFHGHFGLFIGAPLFWEPFPYYRYYPYPSPVYIEQQPPVYIQQQQNYWYYCTDPAGYYPYVQSCPKSWMQVVPQNAPQPPLR